jgi:hypothetical protein
VWVGRRLIEAKLAAVAVSRLSMVSIEHVAFQPASPAALRIIGSPSPWIARARAS